MTNYKKERVFRIRLGVVVFFCLFFLLFGFALAKYKPPGYVFLSGAFNAAKAVKVCIDLKWLADEPSHNIAAPFNEGGIIRQVSEAVQPGVTFFTFFDGEEYMAALLDEQGEKLHQWRIPFAQVKSFRSKNPCALGKANLFIHGAHLYPNGDILVSVEYQGLLRLDKDSNLLWELDIPSHHSVAVTDDGTIWSLSRPVDLKSERAKGFDEGYYLEDHIIKVSPDGELLGEYSVLDILFDSGYQGLLMTGHNQLRYANSDPLHVNDVKILTAAQAKFIPAAEAGDLLISMRAISSLMVINWGSRKVVWSKTGPFMRQHDPEIDEQGQLWIFDNRNATPQKNDGAKYLPLGQVFGGSRILRLPLDYQVPLWQFQGTEEEPFFSSIMGRIQLLANGNILVVEPEGGRLFEITVPAGEVVWEYRNLIKPGYVGRVSDADRFSRDELNFLQAR